MGMDGMQGEAHTPENLSPFEIISAELAKARAAAEARMTDAEKAEVDRKWQEMAGAMLPELEEMRETLDKMMDKGEEQMKETEK
ncbi:MAG: hypothetical protein LBG76_00600 [Treponema sp.]|jgi:hypothetical protein|nr:hypothetical protein [Treponema sp.]